MAGCRPLSQWLSTPARSLMSDPTRSQSRRIRSLAAANTLAAMCVGGHHAIRPRPSSAVCCPQLCDDQQPEALPEAAQLWCRLPWASPVVCEEEVCMEWWWLLLADGCPDAGKPLPDCLGGWTGKHDMAEAGELAQASMLRAGMGLWSTSADVSEEGPNKERAMQQAPCCDAALSVHG